MEEDKGDLKLCFYKSFINWAFIEHLLHTSSEDIKEAWRQLTPTLTTSRIPIQGLLSSHPTLRAVGQIPVHVWRQFWFHNER